MEHNEEDEAQDRQHLDGEDTGECGRQGHQAPRRESRPELVPRLPTTIGNNEVSLTPRSMFVTDGSLLIPTDKASIIHAVEEKIPLGVTGDRRKRWWS